MNFSDKFNVKKEKIKEYGAVDISLVCDIPLFIDPMLIFNSSKEEYKNLHEEIIKYFQYLYDICEEGISEAKIKTYFEFNEIPNNWLGFSKEGNKGAGNGKKFAEFLASNMTFIKNDSSITKSFHIEKALLIYDGSGKDKISDMMTNLLLEYLLNYTQSFSLENIDKKLLREFSVECGFNYETESPFVKTFTLPYILNEQGKEEFVILTPRDILRSDEPEICRKNLERNYDHVISCVDNDLLRTRVDNYIGKQIKKYKEECKNKNCKPSEKGEKKVEKQAFLEALKEYPELYDYFVKYIEENSSNLENKAELEVCNQLEKFNVNASIFADKYKECFGMDGMPNSREELIDRINHFKHCVEKQEGYKLLYNSEGTPISNEDDLQRLFRMVWYKTIYDVTYEGNNGGGEFDVKVSFGAKDKTIAEFKLASNPKIKFIAEQADIYSDASKCTHAPIYVIFFFSAKDKVSSENKIAASPNKDIILKNTIWIDCRNDNKESASKIKNSTDLNEKYSNKYCD